MREIYWVRSSVFRRIALSGAVLSAVVVFCVEATAGEATTTREVVAMLAEEISEEVILAKVDIDGCVCETSGQSIVDLFRAGASEALVLALIEVGEESGEDRPGTGDLVFLLHEGVSEEIIGAKVEVDGCSCDTSAESIVALKQAGASDDLLLFLIRRSEG